MRTVIIYANPNPLGHCAHILSETKKQLQEVGEAFVLIDLYKANYDPVMHANEHYTNKGYDLSRQSMRFQNLIAESNKLIFIYPVWWNTMPAMMKGFFDKVFTAKASFKYVKLPYLWFPIPKGLWTGKQAVVLQTTGARQWQTPFLGFRFKSIPTKDILGFCGVKAKAFDLNNCTSKAETRMPEIEKLVKKGLKWLY